MEMRWTRWIKLYVFDGVRKMDETDLRWSYLIIGVMVLTGIAVNLFMPHGWTVWAFVLAASILLLIHEAADRNTQGFPALKVYGWFGAATALWLLVVFAASAMNPFVILVGFVAMGYQVARGNIKDREKKRLIAQRQLEGRCIHCGEPADTGIEMCMNCGEEPNPDATRLKRVLGVMQSLKRTEQLKAALAPEPPTVTAAKKEQALIARRQKAQGRLKKS
jgi:hypothetical protein